MSLCSSGPPLAPCEAILKPPKAHPVSYSKAADTWPHRCSQFVCLLLSSLFKVNQSNGSHLTLAPGINADRAAALLVPCLLGPPCLQNSSGPTLTYSLYLKCVLLSPSLLALSSGLPPARHPTLNPTSWQCAPRPSQLHSAYWARTTL